MHVGAMFWKCVVYMLVVIEGCQGACCPNEDCALTPWSPCDSITGEMTRDVLSYDKCGNNRQTWTEVETSSCLDEPTPSYLETSYGDWYSDNNPPMTFTASDISGNLVTLGITETSLTLTVLHSGAIGGSLMTSTSFSESISPSSTHVTGSTVNQSPASSYLDCLCPCSKVQSSHKWAYLLSLNLTIDELRVVMKNELAELVANLTVDPKSTSAYKRTLISAKDNRPSATGVGSVGLVFIVLTMLLVVVLDFGTVVKSFFQKMMALFRKWRSPVGSELKENEIEIDIT